jgi:NAD(P)-dependent dehydrogenase (short-subunit alcohol dehydrogenase family)
MMKKILITGYSSKISEAFISLIDQKYPAIEKTFCGRRDNSDIKVDFSDNHSTKLFIQKIHEIKPQYLWLNHGVLFGKKAAEHTPEELSETLNTNMISNLLILEGISTLENLNTVVTSSISPKLGSYDQLYACTKLSCDFLIKTLAPKFPASSRLNGVSPGIVKDAKMTTVRTDFDFLEEKRKLTPTQEFSTSEDVANWVFQLMFQNHNVTGENININGGLFCP